MSKILISQNSNRFNFYLIYNLNLHRDEKVSQNTFAHFYLHKTKNTEYTDIFRISKIIMC